MKILLLHELIFAVFISFYVKGGPGAVVETLHLWPASLQYFKKKLQWQGCLGIPFPRSHLMWKLSALGMPFCYQLLCDICLKYGTCCQLLTCFSCLYLGVILLCPFFIVCNYFADPSDFQNFQNDKMIYQLIH